MRNLLFQLFKKGGRFICFTAVGALGTAAHYCVLIIAVEYSAIDPVLGSFLGAVTGALVNYYLNHAITFKSEVPHTKGLPKFLLVAASGLLLNTAIMAILVKNIGVHYLLSQVLATVAVLSWNYLGSALWAFRAPTQPAPNRESR